MNWLGWLVFFSIVFAVLVLVVWVVGRAIDAFVQLRDAWHR